MKRAEAPRRNRPHSARAGLLAAAFAALCCAASAVSAAGSASARRVVLTDVVRLERGPEGRARLWFPIPPTLRSQTARVLEVRAPLPHRETVDKEFGDHFLYFESKGPVRYPLELEVRYEVDRRGDDVLASPDRGALSARESELYGRPRGKVAVDENISRVARAARRGRPIATARAIYDYVFAHMNYDKTAPGWGQGDSLRACAVGRGNCTDFHSLFMAMAMADGLPARFQTGVLLSTETEKEVGRAYHCWAEFRVDGAGWIPVDVSEAWKNPRRKEELFGRLDADRVTLSLGREIRLEPPQDGKPLNYMAYPYVEIGGKPFADFELSRRYRDRSGSPAAAEHPGG